MITNDIFTREDMEFLVRSGALSADRIIGVQTGGCPHTAIREDASMNFDALDELTRRFPDLDLVFLESGGDNLAASFSPELVDASIYVIDVSGGDKIPRKGGPGVTRSDLLDVTGEPLDDAWREQVKISGRGVHRGASRTGRTRTRSVTTTTPERLISSDDHVDVTQDQVKAFLLPKHHDAYDAAVARGRGRAAPTLERRDEPALA